jgi:hypothetical protein
MKQTDEPKKLNENKNNYNKSSGLSSIEKNKLNVVINRKINFIVDELKNTVLLLVLQAILVSQIFLCHIFYYDANIYSNL